MFSSQPASVTVSGGTVALSAGTTGAAAYQWFLNGSTPIPGATNPILVLSDAAAAAGTYTCVATNTAGSTTSAPATITPDSTADVGRLVNISCRAQVGTGGNILIAGFVVGGQGTSGTEPLLIRASGPALAPFGVPGVLPDPQLQLFEGASSISVNDGWAGDAQVASASSNVGAFRWANTSSHDSALVEVLAAGAYTAQVSGAADDTGVALIEVYDTTQGTRALTGPRLINISARVQVGTGGGVLIAGFVIGGSTARTVLVRASGPALVPFGVAGVIPDPQLQLFSGTTLLASNSGWAGNSAIASAASSVGAFGWSDAASADSALLLTLPPGAYTAQVSGVANDTGVALIELYEVQ